MYDHMLDKAESSSLTWLHAHSMDIKSFEAFGKHPQVAHHRLVLSDAGCSLEFASLNVTSSSEQLGNLHSTNKMLLA